MAPVQATPIQEKKPNKLFSLFSKHKTRDLEQQQAYAATHELQPSSILHIVQYRVLDTETTAG